MKYDEIYHPKSDEFSFEDSLAFIFFVDCINFCFWPYGIEYDNVCDFIKKGLKNKEISCEYFSKVSEKDFKENFSHLFKNDFS